MRWGVGYEERIGDCFSGPDVAPLCTAFRCGLSFLGATHKPCLISWIERLSWWSSTLHRVSFDSAVVGAFSSLATKGHRVCGIETHAW